MRRFLILQVSVLTFLSCGAAMRAQADVIALDGAVVVSGGRNQAISNEKDERDRKVVRESENRDQGYGNNYTPNDRLLIYNGNTSANGGDTFIIKDGKFIHAEDGSYDLGNGSNVNVDQGRVNGSVGRVQIRN